MIFFSNSKKNTFTLNEQVFEGEYENNKKFVKINKLKLVGYNKAGTPYQLTADSAVKETKNIDKIVLYNVLRPGTVIFELLRSFKFWPMHLF